MPIYFYSRTDRYGDFSNFSTHGFECDGKYWRTVEHYFQAQKFLGTVHAEKIRLARTPADAKSLGRSTQLALRSDWEAVKDLIIFTGVLKKFENSNLRTKTMNLKFLLIFLVLLYAFDWCTV